MESFVKFYLKAALAWFAAGVTLGVGMAVHPEWIRYRPAHVHMNLLGFVTMMIYGVAYHVIPRFAGAALYSRRLAMAQWWLANIGLLLMVAGFATIADGLSRGRVLLGVGGTLSALAAYAFVFNIWRTMGRRLGSQPQVERVVMTRR